MLKLRYLCTLVGNTQSPSLKTFQEFFPLDFFTYWRFRWLMPPHFGVAQEINSWSLYKPDPWTFEPADVERNTWRDGLLRKKVHRGAKKTPQEERWSHQASQGQEGKGRQDGAAIQLRRWARSVTQTGALLMHRQRTYWSSQIGAEVTQSISGRSRARPVSTIKNYIRNYLSFTLLLPIPLRPFADGR